jgi:ABC-type transporter Mla subunit MlaD
MSNRGHRTMWLAVTALVVVVIVVVVVLLFVEGII